MLGANDSKHNSYFKLYFFLFTKSVLLLFAGSVITLRVYSTLEYIFLVSIWCFALQKNKGMIQILFFNAPLFYRVKFEYYYKLFLSKSCVLQKQETQDLVYRIVSFTTWICHRGQSVKFYNQTSIKEELTNKDPLDKFGELVNKVEILVLTHENLYFILFVL